MLFRPASIRALAQDRRAASAIEFALVLPVLILLMLGGIQLAMYVNAARRVEMVANSIGEMISQAVPPTGSQTATVNAQDLHFGYDSALVLFPYLMKDAARKSISWWQDINVDFASIQFTKIPGASCGTNPDQSACYTAQVAWTSTGTVGGNYRPCQPAQLPADNGANPSPTKLPRSLYGDGSVIAIDVVFQFVPTFGARYLPSISIAKSVFIQPRYASFIDFNLIGNDGIATKCL